MKKIYIAAVTILLVSCSFSVAFGQRKAGSPVIVKKGQAGQPPADNIVNGTTADCDTINYPISDSWSSVYYVTGTNGSGGFVSGVNQYGDKQKGNYYDLSATANTHLLGARFFFAIANSNKTAELSKKVSFNVYADEGGAPGSQLGSTFQLSLADIKPQAGGYPTDIIFPTAIELPASKKFYVTMDVSAFQWAGSTKDSVVLYSTSDGEVNPGIAWEQWSDDTWSTIDEGWGGLNIALYIFPFVSTSSTGCSTLPVKLLSFNAQRINKDVTLNWQIAEEYNMKGYEVERADNNSAFKTVLTVPALNYAKNQSYTVTDKNAFTTASSVQYRLKQIDGDGSVKYSRVITVKSNTVISDISFVNPFNGALKVQLNLATAQNVSLQVYDMRGKLVTSETKMYSATPNAVILNGTAGLKPGIYILKITAGTEQVQYKIVKQ